VTEGTVVATSGAPRSAAVAAEPQRAAAAAETRQTAEVTVLRQATTNPEARPAATAAGVQQAATTAEARPAATAARVQQEEAAAVVITTVAAVVLSTLLAPAPAGSSRAMAVEIPDDDVPPPGWDLWASLPTPAPAPQTGALVRRWDGCMVAGRPGRGTEASSSRAGLPAPGGPAVSSGQGREHVDAPPPHFAEAQAEQELWEELRDHNASLNRALKEALRIHGGPAWHVFPVRGRLSVSATLPLFVAFALVFPSSGAHQSSFADGRSWRSAPGTGTARSTR
jgi:hypothetical protein